MTAKHSKETHNFCRRCCDWREKQTTYRREEIFAVEMNGKRHGVEIDFVLCNECVARSDHEVWYRTRARDRLLIAAKRREDDAEAYRRTMVN